MAHVDLEAACDGFVHERMQLAVLFHEATRMTAERMREAIAWLERFYNLVEDGIGIDRQTAAFRLRPQLAEVNVDRQGPIAAGVGGHLPPRAGPTPAPAARRI